MRDLANLQALQSIRAEEAKEVNKLSHSQIKTELLLGLRNIRTKGIYSGLEKLKLSSDTVTVSTYNRRKIIKITIRQVKKQYMFKHPEIFS